MDTPSSKYARCPYKNQEFWSDMRKMSECPMKFDAFECDCLWKCVMPLSKTWFLLPNARMPLTKLIFFGLFTYRFVHNQWMLLQNNAFSQFWYHLCAQVSQTVHSDVITLTPKSYCWNLVSFVNVPSATTTFSTKLTMPGNLRNSWGIVEE